MTRITATDTKSSAKPKQTASSKATKTSTKAKTVSAEVKKEKSSKSNATNAKRKNVFVAIGGYFKGSWAELRQVRWPNRRTTWGLTLAVIAFTAFFIAMIILLDYAFQLLFERILG